MAGGVSMAEGVCVAGGACLAGKMAIAAGGCASYWNASLFSMRFVPDALRSLYCLLTRFSERHVSATLRLTWNILMIFFLFYGYVVHNSTTFFVCKEQKFPWLPADEKVFISFQ